MAEALREVGRFEEALRPPLRAIQSKAVSGCCDNQGTGGVEDSIRQRDEVHKAEAERLENPGTARPMKVGVERPSEVVPCFDLGSGLRHNRIPFQRCR
jgi:hypothetical protein